MYSDNSVRICNMTRPTEQKKKDQSDCKSLNFYILIIAYLKLTFVMKLIFMTWRIIDFV